MSDGLVHDVDARARRSYGGAPVTGVGVVHQVEPVDGWWSAEPPAPIATSDETTLPWVLAPERPAS